MKTEDAKQLHVADDLSLPVEYVTHRNAVLAMSGAGKSNLCVVLAEEISKHGVPWVAIDPKGDWWGVRAAATGNGRGLDVPILGGEHGDLPLSPRSGSRMAELVAGGQLQGVFDVSGFDDDEVAQFLIDFGTTLLQKLRTPLHVFCEECSNYLPQPGSSGRLDALSAQCLKVWKKLSTQGRFRGLGYTLISQRAAMVNKSALYQCETLIAMRVVGEHDKKTVRTWIEQQADASTIMRTLALLEDGEAWVCSPQKLKLMVRVRFRRRETFDSGRTPTIGEAFQAPKLSKIDVAALRAEMDAFEEASDAVPDDLQLFEELEQLRARVAELEAAPPTLSEDIIARLQVAVDKLHETGIHAVEAARDVIAAMPPGYARAVVPISAQEAAPVQRLQPKKAARAKLVSPNSVHLPSPDVPRKGKGGSSIERAILTELAQHQWTPLTRQRLALLVGYHQNSKSLVNALGALRTRGSVDGLKITPAGLAELGPFERLPRSTDALIGWYCKNKLTPLQGRLLQSINVDEPKTREDLASRFGYHPNTKAFVNSLGRLRSMGLVENLSISRELRQ